MNKYFLLIFVIIGLTLAGCSTEKLSGANPPKVYIKIGNEKYETKLGTYCWKGTCIDTFGPVEMLKGKEPISVKPGEMITFIMDYEPKPNEIHVTQTQNEIETIVPINENRVTAPLVEGVYYYSYGVWWMDEEEKNLSHGDAFYAFVIEVKETGL